ncbi:MAG: hypothetical protein VB118_08065 [Oscillospiraceae bacterium]|nr:hypothetical protein [Oscillospiraceae bacterium]
MFLFSAAKNKITQSFSKQTILVRLENTWAYRPDSSEKTGGGLSHNTLRGIACVVLCAELFKRILI